ncbi:polysaccharide deacetylase family protein [Streptomyces sp. TLI_171]|uniref:polysaccharide deacetylase family protein n=1 Tax=Streptomyces sp. TLI_171 TaxID=1938859 RepID=UPI000C18A35D|nr:polysaccharide deacetylase family protein [Streptomyces sp. TLI_171]RKE17902.1 peptidoglycan/xylan/chitin deacetylase (PgdA/CDA1 family) [Streptomyces sp. TLI_171]
MRYSGVAWTGSGYEVAVLDEAGRPAAPGARFAAGRVRAVTEHLLGLQREFARAGESLVTVIDSTNGMVDGALCRAGLAMYRADPWVLPARPAFGSVPAADLAAAAVRDLGSVVRLGVDTGTLAGRSAEMVADIEASVDELELMRRAGRCLWADPCERPVVALTFDDGPNPPYTGRILDVLDRYGVPATFFCVGLHALAHRAELERMAAAGHQIANHTWSHPYLPDLSRGELVAQLERTDEAIAAAVGGDGPRMFRPPYGGRTPEVLSWLNELDTTVVLWDVEPSDWALPGAQAITRAVLEQARPGALILMHDGGGDRSQTAEALPGVIEGLLGRGYEFARVDGLPRP